MQALKTTVERAFEERHTLTPQSVPQDIKHVVQQVVDHLDVGTLRVAAKENGVWRTHQWIKKAILLYFQINQSVPFDATYTQFYDKVPLKHGEKSAAQLSTDKVRIVPPAVARKGAFIAPNTVLMPSYVNIGAYIDSGCMIDTWATIGSCAQIGKNVHISGGVGIGGVLEPLQAHPTIIEDNCFIGARSEIVEGVIVETGSVISMGVFIGQSTRIFNRQTGEIIYGRVPAGSVVVAGNLPSKDGTHSLYCAVIVKNVDEKTREKVSLNEILRSIE